MVINLSTPNTTTTTTTADINVPPRCRHLAVATAESIGSPDEGVRHIHEELVYFYKMEGGEMLPVWQHDDEEEEEVAVLAATALAVAVWLQQRGGAGQQGGGIVLYTSTFPPRSCWSSCHLAELVSGSALHRGRLASLSVFLGSQYSISLSIQG